MIAYGEIITDSYDDDNALRGLFRKVFSTPEGREALGRILTDLGFFGRPNKAPINGPEQIALLNYAHQLVSYLGMFHQHDIVRFTDALIDVPVSTSESLDKEARLKRRGGDGK